MRVLIDTHILIWYLNGDDSLPKRIIQILEDADNDVVISVVSLWEIAIKINSGKFEINVTLGDVQQYILAHKVEVLNIRFKALTTFSALLKHHGDPFDRMLISQCISENIPIISKDRHFPSYPVTIIW